MTLLYPGNSFSSSPSLTLIVKGSGPSSCSLNGPGAGWSLGDVPKTLWATANASKCQGSTGIPFLHREGCLWISAVQREGWRAGSRYRLKRWSNHFDLIEGWLKKKGEGGARRTLNGKYAAYSSNHLLLLLFIVNLPETTVSPGGASLYLSK